MDSVSAQELHFLTLLVMVQEVRRAYEAHIVVVSEGFVEAVLCRINQHRLETFELEE